MKIRLLIISLFAACIAMAQDGTMDATFGSSGKTIRNTGLVQEVPTAMLVLPTGKIILAGTSRISGYKNIVVIRLSATGTVEDEQDFLYPFFGGPAAPDNTAFDAVLNTDGGFYVIGRYLAQNTPSIIWNSVILKFNASGTFQFGYTGDLGFGPATTKMAVQADGKLLITASIGDDIRTVRLTTGFALDNSFGTSGTGVVVASIGSSTDVPIDILVQPDGNILIGGYSYNGTNNDFALVRYTSGGVLDAGFNGDGIYVNDFAGAEDYVQSLGLQNTGKIIAVGNTGGDFAMLRLTAGGDLDGTFGTGGKTTSDLLSSDGATSVLVTADNKIFIGGYTLSGNNDFVAAKYTAGGVLDGSFGTGGIAKFNLQTSGAQTSNDLSFTIAVQNGNLVLGGYTSNPGTFNYAFVVTRILNTVIPLPVQLLSFNGRAEGADVNLQWATSNSTIVRFEVERSVNGAVFNKAGAVVPDDRNSQYSFRDIGITISRSKIYYRLKLVESNGSFSYSPLLLLNFSKETIPVVFPNPVKSNLSITVPATQTETVRMHITDAGGRTVKQARAVLQNGTNLLNVNTDALHPGVYFIQFNGVTERKVIPFVKE